MKLKSLFGAAALLSSSAAFAIPVTVDMTEGNTYNTTGISSVSTGAGDMNGMQITALFADGTSDVAILGDTTAAGNGWEASFSASTTYSSPWNIDVTNSSNALISSLIFSGASGNTVFDVLGSTTYTPGSANGKAIQSSTTQYTGSTLDSVAATYTNQVTLNDTFYGDLYETLILDFTSGLAFGDTLSFITDTDSSAIAGDIVSVSVPEPASLILMGLGLAGLGVSRRKAK